MEFFDKLVLPHSGENLQLLKYLLSLAMIIFSVFSGVLLGSSFLSVLFRNKALNTDNKQFYKASFDYIDLIIGNLGMSIGLGVVPFFSIIVIYIQLFHQTGSMIVGNLTISFLLYVMAIIMLYIHRLQMNIEKRDLEANADIDLVPLYFGIPGVLSLLFSLWLFSGSVSLSLDVKSWNTDNTILYSFISWQSILKFVHLLTVSIAMTGIAFIVKYYYWDKKDETDEMYDLYMKKYNGWISLAFAALQPIFFVTSMLSTPLDTLGTTSFGVILLAIGFTFALVHFIYSGINTGDYKLSSYAFYLTVLVFSLVIFNEQISYATASKDQVLKLSSVYDKIQADLALKSGKEVNTINGKEIYEVKCMACHKFDVKLVGPPHKEVLAKYKNDHEGMVKFILNPVKVRPDYPAMPAQGLTPKEVQAVVDYMYKEYGNKLQ